MKVRQMSPTPCSLVHRKKAVSWLYGVAAAVMICSHGVPASAASGQEGTLVRVVGDRVQFGVAQPSHGDKVVEEMVVKMAALRTRSTDRVLGRSDQNAQFPPVDPIAARASRTTKP
jgi:hypothetical protein